MRLLHAAATVGGMYRVTSLALSFALAACGAGEEPVQSTSSASAQLFRGAGSEVRLRCGSQSLRARLRQGQVLARVGDGESKVLAPVADPRAGSGPAYSDGRLTLYKLPDTDSWALATGTSGPAECSREAPVP